MCPALGMASEFTTPSYSATGLASSRTKSGAPLPACTLNSRICAVLTRMSGCTWGVKCARWCRTSVLGNALDSAIHVSTPPSRSDTLIAMSQVVEREVRACRQQCLAHRRSARRGSRLRLPGFRKSPASRRPEAAHSKSPCAVRPVRRGGQNVSPDMCPESKLAPIAPNVEHNQVAVIQVLLQPSSRYQHLRAHRRPADFLRAQRDDRPGSGRRLQSLQAPLCWLHLSALLPSPAWVSLGLQQHDWIELGRFVSVARTMKPSPLQSAALTKLRRSCRREARYRR